MDNKPSPSLPDHRPLWLDPKALGRGRKAREQAPVSRTWPCALAAWRVGGRALCHTQQGCGDPPSPELEKLCQLQLPMKHSCGDKASLPSAWLFDSCHSFRVQGTVDSLCLLHGMPSSSLSCHVMPKQMGSGYVTSVLNGLGQVPEPCWPLLPL